MEHREPAGDGNSRYINATYKDARYAVNRVSLLDAVCSSLANTVRQYNTNRIAGEQCWVDNYISNDPNYSSASVISAALNVLVFRIGTITIRLEGITLRASNMKTAA